MAFNPALPEDKKKRATMLKAQGWTTTDVAKDTGILAATINANWRTWARRYGIELPEAGPAPQTAGSSNEVTSYLIDPKTGERLTDPVTETVELSTKSMPSDSAGIGGSTMRDVIERHTQLQQTQKKAAKAAAVFSSEADEPPAPEPPSDPAPKKPASFELVAEPQGYNPFALLDNINHLIWEQVKAGALLPENWSSSVDIGSGALTMTFTLPLISTKEE